MFKFRLNLKDAILYNQVSFSWLMTITNLSPRARVIDNLRDESETVTAIRGAMATSHPALASITRQFRPYAGAYGIIGVLLVSRGNRHVWREGFLIGFICFDVF